jgi:hypothetical protein
MKSKIAIGALAMLLLGWLVLRHSEEPVPAPPDPATARETITSAAPMPAIAVAVTTNTPAPVSEKQEKTNFLARLAKGEELPVKLEQLAAYLQANRRNAESLLAAYQATHEKSLLEEAMQKYPRDPRVAYTAWFRSPAGPDDPEAVKSRRQALDVLKEAAPDNALANYLSAGNYFASGQPEQAIQEMQAGATKSNFNDYTQDAIQSMTEAYMAAGYSEAEAKLASLTGALLPDLAELKKDGVRLVELAKSYQQGGDGESAQMILQMCRDLGQRLDDANSMTLIQPLVGIALQRMSFEAAAGIAPDADSNQAAQDQLNALLKHRQDIRSLTSAVPIDVWLQTASPEDVIAYCDRQRVFGEQKTLQWLANRNSNP